MKVITGHQPVYLPWLGLFHKISLADTFVFMDDVQYLTKDWNNRNKIKGPHGPFWLTVPIDKKGSASRMLRDIRIDTSARGGGGRIWQDEHWQSLRSSYGKAPFWGEHVPFFEDLYLHRRWERLVDLNEYVLRYLLDVLSIHVDFVRATDVGFEGKKSGLVLNHCHEFDADICVFGALGRDYVVEDEFVTAGILFHYQDYQHPSYTQRFGDFVPRLSVVDLLFNHGPDSHEILLSGNVTKQELHGAAAAMGCPGEIVISHES